MPACMYGISMPRHTCLQQPMTQTVRLKYSPRLPGTEQETLKPCAHCAAGSTRQPDELTHLCVPALLVQSCLQLLLPLHQSHSGAACHCRPLPAAHCRLCHCHALKRHCQCMAPLACLAARWRVGVWLQRWVGGQHPAAVVGTRAASLERKPGGSGGRAKQCVKREKTPLQLCAHIGSRRRALLALPTPC